MNTPIHHFEPATSAQGKTLLLLHGTGGNEQQLLSIGRRIQPGAGLLSPRGAVLENGYPRFFRRFAEGLLDLDDWRVRTAGLAVFLQDMCAQHAIAPENFNLLGFSNGANIGLGLLLHHPELFAGAVLIRPMFVTDDVPSLDLSGKRVLILSGVRDPLVDQSHPGQIREQLSATGALVDLHWSQAGHALVPEDFEVTKTWLGKSSQRQPI